MPRDLVQRVWTTLVYIFLFAPIVMVVVMSVNQSKFSKYPVPSWSLKWYAEAFDDPEIMQAIGTSALIAILSSLIATASCLTPARPISPSTITSWPTSVCRR